MRTKKNTRDDISVLRQYLCAVSIYIYIYMFVAGKKVNFYCIKKKSFGFSTKHISPVHSPSMGSDNSSTVYFGSGQ